LAFSLVASALYLWNDICDIDEDRIDPVKRLRALAGGSIRPSRALIVAALLLLVAGSAALCLPLDYSLVLIGYIIGIILYTSFFKNVMGLDLITAAALLSTRVFAGGAACGVHVSIVLFAYIFLLALSLAHLKRYTELRRRIKYGIESIGRFTYAADKVSLLMKMGLCSGLTSVLVLAVYVAGSQAAPLYKTPALLFVVGGLSFYWIERIWSLARREKITGDLYDFLAADPVTYLVGLVSLAVVWIASIY